MNLSLQQLLALVLAAPALSAIGSSVAGVLQQDGFNEGVNGTIAWAILILAALGNMLLAHQLTLSGATDFNALATAFSGAYSLLISGSLHSLKPWTSGYLPFLKSHVFSIVKADLQITQLRPAVGRTVTTNAVQPPKPIQLPTRKPPVPTPPDSPDMGG